MVSRLVWDQDAAGSSPVASTKNRKVIRPCGFLFCRRLTRTCRSSEVRVRFASAIPLCHFVTFPLTGESPVASTKNRKVTRPCGFLFCRRLALTCRSSEVRVRFASAIPLCHFVTFPLPGESPVASTISSGCN